MHSGSKVSSGVLSPLHFKTFRATLSRIFETTTTKLAYAQILDGTPNSTAYGEDHDTRYRDCLGETSEEAFVALEAFYSQFSPDMLLFEAKVAQEYQDTAPNTAAFNLRLLEMVAVACHDIGAYLFTAADGGLHPIPPKPPSPPPIPSTPPALPSLIELRPRNPTIFTHPGYNNWENYPQGVADCAGYWAESQIFGGVVTFERGELENECKSAFIDRSLRWKLFQLSDDQLQQLVDFGTLKSEVPPIPFRAEKWVHRVFQDEALDLHIFRDRYERKPTPPGFRRSCVVRMEDEPGLKDFIESFNRGEPKWGPLRPGGSSELDNHSNNIVK